jgi:hypothetical protein
MSSVNEIKSLIKEISDELICETHPEVCRLRDQNYNNLESKILNKIFESEKIVSVQTAIAELEVELGHS